MNSDTVNIIRVKAPLSEQDKLVADCLEEYREHVRLKKEPSDQELKDYWLTGSLLNVDVFSLSNIRASKEDTEVPFFLPYAAILSNILIQARKKGSRCGYTEESSLTTRCTLNVNKNYIEKPQHSSTHYQSSILVCGVPC